MTNETTSGDIRLDTTNLFRHRLQSTDMSSAIGLADTVGMMAFRAKGVLSALAMVLDGGAIISGPDSAGAIYAAIAELDDIQSIVNAHHEAMKDGGPV